MGDVAVSALVKQVLGHLSSISIKEFGLLWGFKDDVLALKDDFEQLEAVLQDAEQKHIKEKGVELWLRSLKSASLKVENVLDEISAEALLQRLHKGRGVKYRVKDFFSLTHNQLIFRVRIAHEVKAIRTKLDAIASRRFVLNLTPGDASHVDVGMEGEMPVRETGALIHASLVFGRKEETELAIEKICNKDIGKCEDGEVRVYSIRGMGGVGKTTLAQLVYNHERVGKDFSLRCWVHVSEKFQVKVIIKKIIEFINKVPSECTLTELSMLQDTLQSKLRGNKFLIVLDDVWIEENEKTKWEELSKTLSCGADGSTVVTTTRSHITSRMLAKVCELQHELGCLSKEDSWLLFSKFAFAQGREGDDVSELEPIGRKIIEKCKELPLAVKTLGSLMWSKNSASDWQRVKGNNIWEFQENNILPALKLSYNNLLPHLKRCFTYCCLFPKGYVMDKGLVIQLWVVNGFIPPKGKIDVNVLGEEIFDCLVWRSFFQVVSKDRFKMHDLIHDMVRHLMRHDCLILEPACNEVRIPNEVLHLSSSRPDKRFIFSSDDLGKLASLRSVFMFRELRIPYFRYTSEPEYKFSEIFNQMYLRVLYLAGIKLMALPGPIFKLKYLKYLNLSHSSIKVLPESIMYLQNLQMLILTFCTNLCKLPESICKLKHLKHLHLSGSRIEVLPEGLKYMTNLQHLDINLCRSLKHLPLGIKELTSLQILPLFPVGGEAGAKIRELGDLNLLEGKLEISRLENVEGLSEAKSANLKCKRNLSVLELRWSDINDRESNGEIFSYDEEALEGLEPNPNLKRLKIYFYFGKSISPSWMATLRNLVEISFDGCTDCERILGPWRLPNLRVIELSFMPSLKCLYEDDINMSGDITDMFLCLEKLNIDNCWNLVSLPSNLPKLKVLTSKVISMQ